MCEFCMPKVKSELMDNEDFVRMYTKKYGTSPKELFNEYGENFNTLEFYLENGQLKLFVRSDIARAMSKQLESNTRESNSRTYRELDRRKISNSETLQNFYYKTQYAITGAKYQLMVDNQPNLSVLRFEKVGKEDGIRVTIAGVYLLDDVKTWGDECKKLIAECQKELMSKFVNDFRGYYKVKVTAKVEYVDEVDNS